jgi:hypothetical protein
MFRLTRGGADYNTLDVRGAEVRVAANRYLAVDHGTHVSLLRAGRAAPWFQTAPAAGARVALFAGAAAPELPVVGQALFFEKTLLAAGESPDIVLAYENEGRR